MTFFVHPPRDTRGLAIRCFDALWERCGGDNHRQAALQFDDFGHEVRAAFAIFFVRRLRFFADLLLGFGL